MKIKRLHQSFSSHGEAGPASARIVRRWPWITTRIVWDDGRLYVEYALRDAANAARKAAA